MSFSEKFCRNFCNFAYHFCGNSSVGRASASQAEGRGFESRLPLNVCLRRATVCNCCSFFLRKCLQTSLLHLFKNPKPVGSLDSLAIRDVCYGCGDKSVLFQMYPGITFTSLGGRVPFTFVGLLCLYSIYGLCIFTLFNSFATYIHTHTHSLSLSLSLSFLLYFISNYV